jgi:hypothetical protein
VDIEQLMPQLMPTTETTHGSGVDTKGKLSAAEKAAEKAQRPGPGKGKARAGAEARAEGTDARAGTGAFHTAPELLAFPDLAEERVCPPSSPPSARVCV